MAELIAKKSSNVVSNNSNKKNNDVCGVQSNNGLIDLDNLTTSNNELITLCDETEDEDDLIITRNAKNESSPDDKSLQEIIESELALRINSVNEIDDKTSLDDDDDDDDHHHHHLHRQHHHRNHSHQDSELDRPEMTIKKIIIEPRPDPLDINAEFIGAEMEHYTIVEDPYTYRNGNASPGFGESRSPERPACFTAEAKEQSHRPEDSPNEPERIDRETSEDPPDSFPDVQVVGPEVDIVEDEIVVRSTDDFGSDKIGSEREYEDESEGGLARSDKHRAEENDAGDPAWLEPEETIGSEILESEEREKNSNLPDVWLNSAVSGDASLDQFSDDFEAVSSSCREKNRSEVEEPEEDGRGSNEIRRNPEESSPRERAIDRLADSSEPDENSSIDVRSDCKMPRAPSTTEADRLESQPETVVETDAKIIEELEKTRGPERDLADRTIREDTAKAGETRDNLAQFERDIRAFAEDLEAYAPMERNREENEAEGEESSWMTVEEATNDRNKLSETASEANASEESRTASTSESTVASIKITETNVIGNDEEDDSSFCNSSQIDSSNLDDDTATRLSSSNGATVAPLATPDDESSEFSNPCHKESREEVLTSSSGGGGGGVSVLVSSTTATSVKSSTKTKKKKIEGVAGNDASPTLTPRTKKTKKSKKNDLEKENISVNIKSEDPSMHTGGSRRRVSQEAAEDICSENDLSNVNVKSLTKSYVSETSRGEQEKSNKEVIETGVSIKQLCRSFGDISNMTEMDQSNLGISESTTETQEKAKSMDDLRLCQRDFSKLAKEATVFIGVSVKALRASYCSLANLTRGLDEEIGDRSSVNRAKFEKSSFSKFDALSKKSVLNARSSDPAKLQQQLNSVGQNGDASSNCRSCGKVVFQMEQTKAEGLVWHKNCFRCVQCGKQLNVDNYQSHESTLYCKAHFKELFQPKPVEESDQPVRPRKPEMIIRENQPKELPPDVVRASDKPDLGLEELSALNVKSRFQVFEKTSNETNNEIERSPSQVVKRSPSILSKLAKFQAKGMDIGVADDSLNGIPFEESSESEEEEQAEDSEDLENDIVKAKRATRERPMSFTKMDDIKNRWECTSQQGRRESQREARKEEIAGIRSKLFMGKQGKMKEMYQQAVAESERVTKTNPTEEIQHSTHARTIKERFERGEPIAASDGEYEAKLKQEKPDEEVIAAGISRKSRSLFLELDASAAKTGRPVTPVNPKTPTDLPRRARDAFMGRQVSDDVVRSTDTTEEVQVETSDITNKFKFFETYREPTKERKTFRITPPRDDQVKTSSPDREIYRDPDVVRADDKVDKVVHTDTARKMLSIFRQMEENASKEDIPDGPKPLKRFTPPPEDKFAKATASESEDDEDEEAEDGEDDEDSGGDERDPNYVRASDKVDKFVEDEFLKQAQNAARAKTLRAKFEHWETSDGKAVNHHGPEMDMAQGNGDQASIESASSLRARFESLGSQPSDLPRAPKVKVNRFVEIQTICMDVCESCGKKVYPLEKVETNNKIFHKQCFRCLQCNCVLRMDTFTLNNGKLYCIPHFKQLFIARGNYDEGFGVDPHKNKWSTNNTNSNSNSPPGGAAIAVSNGRATPVANRV